MSRRTVVGTFLAVVALSALIVAGQLEWVASGAHVGFTVMLGAGTGTVVYLVLKIYDAPKVPADKAAARDELEYNVRRVINCNMQLMEACRDLADLGKRLPPEYRPIAEQTLRFAKLMEEATYAEGVEERIFPRPLFSAGDATPVPAHVVIEDVSYVPPPLAQMADRIAQGELGPASEAGDWVAGQLITR
jgi:hypothetical protein